MSDDQKETMIIQPVKVVYCDKCGMPPEYCEYGPDFERECVPWMKKNHPEIWSKIKAELSGSKDGSGGDPAVAEDADDEIRPTAPWTIEERLTAFYEKYQPDKLSDVPSLLEKYAGKEDKLFVALVKKYGPEPEDPYYDDSDNEDDDEDGIADGVDGLQLAVDGKKRRGVKAKKTAVVETKVIVKKEVQKKKKALTIVSGMETVPNLKLKDVAKAFSKKFAGSSSVKDAQKGGQGKEIILQGDHLEGVAEMIVKEFKVKGSNVWLDFDGDVVQYG